VADKKPTAPFEIDWSHPLTDGLCYALHFPNKIDTTGYFSPPTGDGTLVVEEGEEAYAFSPPSAAGLEYSNHDVMTRPSSEITVIVKARHGSTGGDTYAAFLHKNKTSGYVSYAINQLSPTDRSSRFNISTSTGTNQTTSAVTMTANTYYYFVGRWISNSLFRIDTYDVEGKFVSSNTGTVPTGTLVYDTDPLTIGVNEGTDQTDGAVKSAVVWDRSLTDDEVERYVQNEYQIIRPSDNSPVFLGELEINPDFSGVGTNGTATGTGRAGTTTANPPTFSGTFFYTPHQDVFTITQREPLLLNAHAKPIGAVEVDWSHSITNGLRVWRSQSRQWRRTCSGYRQSDCRWRLRHLRRLRINP